MRLSLGRGRQRRLEVALGDVADAPGRAKPSDLDVRVEIRAHRDELLLDGRGLDLIAEVSLAEVPTEADRVGQWQEPPEERGRAVGLGGVRRLAVAHAKEQIALGAAVLRERPGAPGRIGVTRRAARVAVADHPRVRVRARRHRHQRETEGKTNGPAEADDA